jgi:biotin operon repressor
MLRRLTGDWWTVDELAADMAIHRRTVWRILRAIRREGLELQAARRDADHRVMSYRLRGRWWEGA